MTDLTWALSSCALILAVIALRAAFGKKLRPGLRYALWGLVLLRLLLPTQLFTAPWGVSAELPERMAERDVYLFPMERIPIISTEELEGILRINPSIIVDGPVEPSSYGYGRVTPDETEVVRYAVKRSVADILVIVWRAGVGVTAAVFLVSNLRFYARLRKRRTPLDTDCPLRVYAVEKLSSSCLFGNAVYVAADTAADETRLRHVLAHELSHYRHGDPVWTLLRCAALSLHWYNPLVWWAAALARQDSELCADAGALKRLGEDERESYGATLIELSARRAKKASLLCTATAMTNGKKSLRERVTMIAHSPRVSTAIVTAVVCIAAVSALCAFAGAEPVTMTEEEALDALEASFIHRQSENGGGYEEFTLPAAYGRAGAWSIQITGRMVCEDGTSEIIPYFEGETWKPGPVYAIWSDGLSELNVRAELTGRDGERHERAFDVFLPAFVMEEEENAETGQTVRWEADFDGDGTAERLAPESNG